MMIKIPKKKQQASSGETWTHAAKETGFLNELLKPHGYTTKYQAV